MRNELLAGRYRIDGLIAEGGMAKVFKGTDERLGRTVAIKILAGHLAGDPQFVTRFEAEAKAAASLDHPNIVRVFDTGADADRHFIVMEHVDGPTLAGLLAGGRSLEVPTAVEVATRVCAALSAAHALGIVHRDIKPGNIMLEDGRTVKVTDFGIAKTAMANLTQVGDVLGTAAYLSPEQARGAAVDYRSDLYSTGSVLYQMLTGRPPLPGETLLEVANRLAHQRPVRPSELNPAVPPDLDKVVMRALEKDPKDRYASAFDMREALEALEAEPGAPTEVAAAPAAGEPGTVVLPNESPRRRRPTLPRVVVLVLLGLAALFAGGGMLLSALGGDAQPPPAEPTLGFPELVIEAESEPEPEPEPSPEPVEELGGSDPGAVAAAIGELWSVVESAASSGALSVDAAEEILEEVVKARSEYEAGDHADAVKEIGDAREELQKHREDGEVGPEADAAIAARLDRLQRLVSL